MRVDPALVVAVAVGAGIAAVAAGPRPAGGATLVRRFLRLR